jgi:hypothetical protein
MIWIKENLKIQQDDMTLTANADLPNRTTALPLLSAGFISQLIFQHFPLASCALCLSFSPRIEALRLRGVEAAHAVLTPSTLR